jgi:hypothetical protein
MLGERSPDEATQGREERDLTLDMAPLVAALGGGPATDSGRAGAARLDRPAREAARDE